MRTISTGAEDVLNSPKYDVHVRLEVENSTGAMVSLSSLGGKDWVESTKWDWNIDQPVAELRATLARDRGPSSGESISPLDEESTHNIEQGSTVFGALLDVGRGIDVYTAVTTPGGGRPSATSDYEWVFQGEIDEVLWQKSPIQIVGRSKNFAICADRWIESSSFTYGESTGDSLEITIQQVLADWTNLSTSILLTPTTPGFLVAPPYTPEKQQVLGAITTLSQLIGWELQDIWSTDSTTWRIRLGTPDRTATSSDATWVFGPQHYFSINRMSLDRQDVRNAVDVDYLDSTAATRKTESVESTVSQDKYGRGWMELVEADNSPISSSSEANTLAQAALDDLKDPPATLEIEVPYWYPGELNDYYEFTGNEIHFSTEQYFAVYGLSHELSKNRHRTRIRVRGQPAGQYLQWLTYPGGGNTVFAEVTGIEIAFSEKGETVVSVCANDLTQKIYVTVGNDTAPSDPTVATNDGEIVGRDGTVDTGVKITTGNTAFVKVVAADGAGILGPIAGAKHQRKIGPVHKDVTVRATPASTTTTTLETITIPANKLGLNGGLRMDARFALNVNTTDAKLIEFNWGGALLFSILADSTGVARFHVQMLLFNQGAADAQESWELIVSDESSGGPTTPSLPSQSSTEDTTTDTDIVITGEVDNTADTITLELTHVEFIGTD